MRNVWALRIGAAAAALFAIAISLGRVAPELFSSLGIAASSGITIPVFLGLGFLGVVALDFVLGVVDVRRRMEMLVDVKMESIPDTVASADWNPRDPLLVALKSFHAAREAEDRAHRHRVRASEFLGDDLVDGVAGPAFSLSGGHAAIMPGLMISLGMLGTFVGISIGLGSLSLNDDLAAQVGELVGSLASAFWTSIVGLLLAVVTRIALSTVITQFDGARSRLTEHLSQQPRSEAISAAMGEMDVREAQIRSLRVQQRIASELSNVGDSIQKIADRHLENVAAVVRSIVESLEVQLGDLVAGPLGRFSEESDSVARNLGGLTLTLGTVQTGMDEIAATLADAGAVAREEVKQLSSQTGSMVKVTEKLGAVVMQAEEAFGKVAEGLTLTQERETALARSSEALHASISKQVEALSTVVSSLSSASAMNKEMTEASVQAMERFRTELVTSVNSTLVEYDRVLAEAVRKLEGARRAES